MKNWEFQEQRYNDLSSYDYERNHTDRIKNVLSMFEPCLDGKILDIGCGDGYITQLIGKKTGTKMYGCDIPASALKKAKAKGIIVNRVDLDGYRLPYSDECFDAVFAGEIIEHILDTDNFIKEIRRILKKGGYLVLTTPNLSAWYNRIALLFGWQPWNLEISTAQLCGNPFFKNVLSDGHVRAFTNYSLNDILERYYLCVEKQKGSRFLVHKLFSSIDSLISTISASLAGVVIIKARKSH